MVSIVKEVKFVAQATVIVVEVTGKLTPGVRGNGFGLEFVVEVTSYAGPDEPSVDVLAQFGRQGGNVLQRSQEDVVKTSSNENPRTVRRKWKGAVVEAAARAEIG